MIEEVKETIRDKLFEISGVSSVEINHVEERIIVGVEYLSLKEVIPDMIAGYKVVVKYRPPSVAFVNRKEKHRPVVAGVSISAYLPDQLPFAGTLGTFICDKDTEKWFILSNLHVISQFGFGKEPKIDTEICQPGSLDGGMAEDNIIGCLDDFIPIDTTMLKYNHADAAIASIYRGIESDAAIIDEDGGLIKVCGILKDKDLKEGMKVKKYGRTTGYTEGIVDSTSADVIVSYGDSIMAKFADVIRIKPVNGYPFFLFPGDSGSTVLTMDNKFVGLGFAGSLLDSVSDVCKADYVLPLLDVKIPSKDYSMYIIMGFGIAGLGIVVEATRRWLL